VEGCYQPTTWRAGGVTRPPPGAVCESLLITHVFGFPESHTIGAGGENEVKDLKR